MKFDRSILKLWTFVNRIEIELTKHLLHKALRIPEGGVCEWNFEYDEYAAYAIMTELSNNPDDVRQQYLTSFNTNRLPPLKRLLHHIFTTIITPQSGGRSRLIET